MYFVILIPELDKHRLSPFRLSILHTWISIHTCVLTCFSRVWLCATVWNVARQAPLSLGFSRQEYWNGFPCPPPGDFSDPEIEIVSLTYPALAYEGFPGGSAGEESTCNVGDRVGKMTWRRERLPTPVSWPREFYGRYSPWGCKESDTTERLSLSLPLAPPRKPR